MNGATSLHVNTVLFNMLNLNNSANKLNGNNRFTFTKTKFLRSPKGL